MPILESNTRRRRRETYSKVTGFKVKIYYEDTDAGGIVYHSNYFGFAERARTQWLHDNGIFHKDMQKLPDPVGFALRSCSAEFKKPAFLEDELSIKTKFIELKGATTTIRQEFYKENELVTVVTVQLVCVGIKDLKPRRFPEIFIEAAKKELAKEKGEK